VGGGVERGGGAWEQSRKNAERRKERKKDEHHARIAILYYLSNINRLLLKSFFNGSKTSELFAEKEQNQKLWRAHVGLRGDDPSNHAPPTLFVAHTSS
jgi:hypothetical protein